MVVTGDAGIGKTRLIQEAIGRLDPRPGAVLIGRARPEAAGPFVPLVAEADVALVDGSLDDARRSADEAVQLANTLGAERELAHAHRMRALVAHREGDRAAAEANLEESRDIATQVGEPTLRWCVLLAEVELRRCTADERALLAAEEAIRANLPASLQAVFGVGSITLP